MEWVNPKELRRFFIFGAVFLGFFIVNGFSKHLNSSNRLKVIYPVSLLLPNGRLIDPIKLDSVYHYYLLENLSSGLITDSQDSASGYRGILAESWSQESKVRWTFRIRPDLKWSDGSSLTGKYIAAYLTDLSKTQTKHLQTIRRLRSATWDETSQTLILVFLDPTNSTLLHELSLADASILHPTNISSNWKITSGPYSDSSDVASALNLHLTVNHFHPSFSEEIPQSVELYQPTNRDWSFTEEQADLWPVAPPAFSQRSRNKISGAPAQLIGPPTIIYFFEFNPNHPAAKNVDSRKEFASLVQSYFSRNVPKLPEARFENQFVPPGYASRLPEDAVRVNEAPTVAKHLRNMKLSISLFYFAEEFPWMANDFELFLKNHEIDVKLTYDRYGPTESEDYFARTSMFSGNQKDSIGTWNFLFSGRNAELGAYLPLVRDQLSLASQTMVHEEKENLLQQVHSISLKEALLVPFLLEGRAAIHSQRISLKLWNPFDLRIRLYDIRWK